MKLHYKLLLFLVPTALDAQLDSIPQSFIMPSTELGYSIHMGSTGMNNDMLYKLGLGGHISSEAIDRNEEGMGKVSKVGSISNLDLTHYFKAPLFGQREKFRWRSVGVNYATAQSAIFAKDAWRLLFKGNSDYLGQTLEINKLNYTRWNSTSLNASFSLSEKTSRIGERLTLDYLSFGLDLVHQFNNARFGNSDLYTDSNANFINTRLQGAYVLGNSNRALDGIGTHIGAGFKIGRLKLSIDKLGFAYMGNLNSYKVNTEQTFGGNFKSVDDIPVKTISQADIQRSQLNSGAWVNKQRDTIINTFVPTKENASAIRLLPFIIQAEFASEDKGDILSAYYQNINGMFPYVSYQKRLLNTPFGHIYASASVGGFDTYDLGLQLKIKPKRYTHIDIDFRGLEALIAPQSTHGTLIGLKLKQYWE